MGQSVSLVTDELLDKGGGEEGRSHSMQREERPLMSEGKAQERSSIETDSLGLRSPTSFAQFSSASRMCRKMLVNVHVHICCKIKCRGLG